MKSNLSYSLETLKSGKNWRFFIPHDLENWRMTFNKANLRDLIAVMGLVILLKIGFKSLISDSCNLEIWWMTSKNNRALLLYYVKLCASFQSHWWIQTGVTVRKWLNWVMTSVTLTFDLWPWPFAWTSLLSLVTTPEISWYDDGNIVQKVWQTDGRTDWSVLDLLLFEYAYLWTLSDTSSALWLDEEAWLF